MHYNITIQNNGALPIPYIDKCGDAIMVAALYKDKPIFRDALFIGATQIKQILVHCTTIDTIIEPSPDLEITIARGQKEE